ncbi:MAG: IPTL-CTERM sorting domain-containing protein [Thermoanaerobaculia bacterium]
MRVTSLLLIIAATAFPASGAIDRPMVGGDVVIAGYSASASGGEHAVKVFDSSGSELGRFEGGRGEVRFAPDGTLAILDRKEIRFLRPDGSIARTVVLSPRRTDFPMEWPNRIAFTRDGAFFLTDGNRIVRYSSSGVPDPWWFANSSLAIGFPSIFGLDMAPDQCTLFASEADVTVTHACGATPYRFQILPTRGMGIRLLPDGTFVTRSARVQRYSQSGLHVRSYTPPGQLLAVDANPRYVWVETARGTAQRLDLDTDVLVGTPIVTGFTHINGLAPVGEWRASVEGVQTIPTLSEWMLIALAVGLGAVAVRRLA